jgi:type II secretory pathway pseudopilin PulG
VIKRALRRLRCERGFGLVELLMAMTILNVGILALIATFSSGAVSIKRASRISTATALADSQLEIYRGQPYSAIALDATSVSSADNTYKCDSALGGSCPNSTSAEVTTTCTTPLPNECKASRAVTGADHGTYRVDTYILTQTPTNGRVLKLVTVVVRDSTTSQVYVRQTSTFDQATG